MLGGLLPSTKVTLHLIRISHSVPCLSSNCPSKTNLKGVKMHKPKLLIIDDDLGILDSFSRLLSAHFEVSTSDTVESGISQLDSNEYSVAVIDMHFRPDDAEGGMRIIEYMVKNDLQTRGIVLTAHGNIENCRTAMKEGG